VNVASWPAKLLSWSAKIVRRRTPAGGTKLSMMVALIVAQVGRPNSSGAAISLEKRLRMMEAWSRYCASARHKREGDQRQGDSVTGKATNCFGR
jgi:hypothetical protein